MFRSLRCTRGFVIIGSTLRACKLRIRTICLSIRSFLCGLIVVRRGRNYFIERMQAARTNTSHDAGRRTRRLLGHTCFIDMPKRRNVLLFRFSAQRTGVCADAVHGATWFRSDCARIPGMHAGRQLFIRFFSRYKQHRPRKADKGGK